MQRDVATNRTSLKQDLRAKNWLREPNSPLCDVTGFGNFDAVTKRHRAVELCVNGNTRILDDAGFFHIGANDSRCTHAQLFPAKVNAETTCPLKVP